jgi:hypothetical protein
MSWIALMQEKLELRNTISYVGNKNLPLLRLFRYKEAFSFTFVEQVISELKLSNSDLILDPFCGMGTTLFASSLNGISSVGIDRSPLAVFVSSSLPLLLTIESGYLRESYQKILSILEKQPLAPIAEDVPIIKIAFPPDALITLRKLKSAIDKLDTPIRDVMTLLFLSILEECSYTSKDGQFLRLNRSKNIVEPTKALENKIYEAEKDLYLVKQLGWHKKWRAPVVMQGDARQMSQHLVHRSPTAIITSPPYVNRYDYTRSYSIELCFGFVQNYEELKAMRSDMLRSHIEARVNADEYPNHYVIQEIIKSLEKRRSKMNNPRIPIMLKGYFVDMELVIREFARVLAPNSWVVMVVGNVRYDGEIIPVDTVLCDMAEDAGFDVKAIWIARYKGNSSQQMKKYGRSPVRESVIVWQIGHLQNRPLT